MGVRNKDLVDRLWARLEPVFHAAGDRKAKCEWEPVPTTALVRLHIRSKIFKHMVFGESLDFVWQALRSTLPPKDYLRVSMVYPLTPDEEL